MKRKPGKSGFIKHLAAETTLLSADPLIGLLELETDSGKIDLAVNRIVAERLHSAVAEFLRPVRAMTRQHLRSSVRNRAARMPSESEVMAIAEGGEICRLRPFRVAEREMHGTVVWRTRTAGRAHSCLPPRVSLHTGTQVCG
ncbi:hypothetical protein [Mesorhizobium sp.]|uniref:hypothetical protein n=1 Tax=Mesorhizobium sp. TaxID=1871066 RepID=UPI0025BE05C9|nr:hypothetical protein [Mesorhizobium sp.]